MDNFLVEIIFPGMDRSYDFWIPKRMTVQTAIEQIVMEIVKIICSKRTGEILCIRNTMLEAGVRSGDTLVLL